MVTPGADIVRELYLAAVLDRTAKRIRLMGSAEGGMDIEVLAETRPEAIHSLFAHPHLGLLDHQARELAFALGLGAHLPAAVAIAKGVFRAMVDNDADLVEINPLAVVRTTNADGSITESLQALDAKVTIDDSALHRHPDLEAMRDLDEEDPVDVEARAPGPQLHPPGRHDRLHGQRRRTGDGDHGPGQAGRRRARQLPGHRRRGARGQGGRGAAPDPRRPQRGPCWSTSSAASRAATRWRAAWSRRAPSRSATCPWWCASWAPTPTWRPSILAQAGEGIQTATSLDDAVQKAVAIARSEVPA